MPGDFIREIIDKTGYTQKEIARRLKVTPTAVSDWTRSLYLPEMAKLEALLKLLPQPVNLGDCLRLPTVEDEMRKIAREEADRIARQLKSELSHLANPPPDTKPKRQG